MTQKYFYRFSKSRGKADYFEGRDDSGVVSARFMEEPGGNDEYRRFYLSNNRPMENMSTAEVAAYTRLLENCEAMGHPKRPETGPGTIWHQWFGNGTNEPAPDRCRILFTLNTVGMGRGTMMLWETNPPPLHAEGPMPWRSEQETAATHLERNLKEIDAMCASGQIAARIQMLVCEPIAARWIEWMDSHVTHCGGKPWPVDRDLYDAHEIEDRPSPIQIVVAATAKTGDSCHDLKSGFMEKRMQDIVLAPPYMTDKGIRQTSGGSSKTAGDVKTTHPDLVSSEDHDLYVALKWSSLVTIRAVQSFLQASADIAAAASSPIYSAPLSPEDQASVDEGTVAALHHGPSSPFVIPSFVRVSYVSEENSKIAKWRMHGDFFHPAAWEICKDSFDVTWIPHSLSGPGGVTNVCASSSNTGDSSTERRLTSATQDGSGIDCGQWWVYFAEMQMPTTPDVFANEATPPPVQGGSNFFWMVTERQRREIVHYLACRHDQAATIENVGQSKGEQCPQVPQAVIPLGDLESFLINFTPNTALGKKHINGRRPGYSHEDERAEDRRRVKERKQLHDQEEIEKALFDYTIYPAALFHKDATLKAARARDAVLTKTTPSASQTKKGTNPSKGNEETVPAMVGPQTVKSSYYDITITKPRPPVLGWCQNIARRGLCTLYSDYFRLGNDVRCREACGLQRNFTPIGVKPN
jgi:hypothetical protein